MTQFDIFSDNRNYYSRTETGNENTEETKLVKKCKIFENEWIVFRNDIVEIPGVAEHKPFLRLMTPSKPGKPDDGTVVVAIWPSSDLIAVVKQYRYPAAVWEVALPRGFANLGDEDKFLTGFREFGEEVGGRLNPGRRWSLGRLLTDSGKLYDAPHLIMAELAVPASAAMPPNPDDTEVIAASKFGNWIPFHMLQAWVETGRIVDSFTCAAIARLRPHFNKYGKFDPDFDILNSYHLKESDRLFNKVD